MKHVKEARLRLREQMAQVRQDVSLDLSPAALRRLQKQDFDCNTILKFLSNRSLPEDDYTRKWLLLNKDKFLIHESVLYEVSAKTPLGEPLVRIVVPKSM